MSIIEDGKKTATVGETDYVGFIFDEGDLPAGVVISAADVAVNPAAGLTLHSPSGVVAEDGASCWAWYDAVAAGEYDIAFTVTFSDGKTLVRTCRVTVYDAPIPVEEPPE